MNILINFDKVLFICCYIMKRKGLNSNIELQSATQTLRKGKTRVKQLVTNM